MSSSQQKERLKEAQRPQRQLVPITSNLSVNTEDACGGAAAMSGLGLSSASATARDT